MDPWTVFFNRDLPVLQERLSRIATALERLVELKEMEINARYSEGSVGHGD